jgi:hypothetical protein
MNETIDWDKIIKKGSKRTGGLRFGRGSGGKRMACSNKKRSC